MTTPTQKLQTHLNHDATTPLPSVGAPPPESDPPPTPATPAAPTTADAVALLRAVPTLDDRALADVIDAGELWARPIVDAMSLNLAKPDRHAGIALLAEWRARAAIGALMRTLVRGEDECARLATRALTRIGGPALVPLQYLLFSPKASTRSRCRAITAIAAVGVAACDHGDAPTWMGNADQNYAEACAALHLVLTRNEAAPSRVLLEAARRLCDLRYTAAWPLIKGLFGAGSLPQPAMPGFDLRHAHELMRGHYADFGLRWYARSLLPDVRNP